MKNARVARMTHVREASAGMDLSSKGGENEHDVSRDTAARRCACRRLGGQRLACYQRACRAEAGCAVDGGLTADTTGSSRRPRWARVSGCPREPRRAGSLQRNHRPEPLAGYRQGCPRSSRQEGEVEPDDRLELRRAELLPAAVRE